MKKTIALLLISMVGLNHSLRAQEDNDPSPEVENTLPKRSNVIKTKPIRTIAGLAVPVTSIPLNLTYERALTQRISLSANVIFGPSRELDRIKAEVNSTLASNIDPAMGSASIGSLSTKRLYVSPEIRFYAGKKGAPRGFYFSIEPYYSSLKTTMDLDYGTIIEIPEPMSGNTYFYAYNNSYEMTSHLKNFGGVIGIGNQWLIGDRVSLDILWLGFGAGIGSVTNSIDGELIDKAQIEADISASTGYPVMIDDEDVPTWETLAATFEESFGETLSTIPYLGSRISFDAETDGISADYSGLLTRFRLLNISLGVAF